jgi:hemoglobin/transferrin/lactoferrin receptor protein
MLKNSILTIILIVSSFIATAQKIIVKDANTLSPIEFVSVSADSAAISVFTDQRGSAQFSGFKNRNQIHFTKLGYNTFTSDYESIEKDAFVVLLHHSNFSLDEVVISATRWEQSQRDIVNKIQTISSNDVKFQNPQTTADLLSNSGEVFVQKSQGAGGSPMIRGFSTNRLLISVDGVRMNTAIFRSGNLQNVISIDPFAIERAEVFYGPGSVMFGSDAIGGVMSFYTLRPKFSGDKKLYVSGNASSRFSSANNEFTAHFDINVGGQKWASVTSYSLNRFGDLRMGKNGPDEYLRKFYVVREDSMDRVVSNADPLLQTPSEYSQMNLLQKVAFKPGENWLMTYTMQYSTTGDFARYDRLLRTKDGLPRSAEWYYGPQTWLSNALTVDNFHKNAIYDKLAITLAYQYFNESRHDRDFNKVVLRHREEKVDAYSLNLDFSKDLSINKKLLYGMELVTNLIESTGTDEDISSGESITGPARYPESNWASMAVFASYQQRFSEKILMQTGLRYNHFLLNADFDTTFYPFPYTTAKLNDGALTGSLGFVYQPADQWMINANLSTGFRSPNVDDLGKVFDSQPGTVIVPNPDLGAEYAYNTEIGISKVFGELVKIDFSTYYTLLEDAMVRRPFTLNGEDSIYYNGELSGVMALQNAAMATIYGIQAGLEIKLPSGFGFYSSLTWQKGEEELEDGSKSPLRSAAPMFGLTKLTFTASKLQLNLYADYNSEVSFANMPEEEKAKDYMYASDAEGNPYSPSWYTLNFKAQYQINDLISVTSGIENITDQRYRTYSSGIVSPGRNFIISANLRF